MPVFNNNSIAGGRKPTTLATKASQNFEWPHSADHIPIGFEGTTWNSPFTESSEPPLAYQYNVATQEQYPALKADEAGSTPVPLAQFKRVPPYLRTAVTAGHSTPQAIAGRTMGPSPNADTPFQPVDKGTVRYAAKNPVHGKPPVPKHESTERLKPAQTGGSFHTLAHNTLTGNPHNDPKRGRWTGTPTQGDHC